MGAGQHSAFFFSCEKYSSLAQILATSSVNISWTIESDTSGSFIPHVFHLLLGLTPAAAGTYRQRYFDDRKPLIGETSAFGGDLVEIHCCRGSKLSVSSPTRARGIGSRREGRLHWADAFAFDLIREYVLPQTDYVIDWKRI
ncbi:hypothetical protein B0H19DRAFT_1187370 [Mycena capillaripes]|nr:hypothetical protein B0H19DRAFT_1187370 [Mycena capillaripes]